MTVKRINGRQIEALTAGMDKVTARMAEITIDRINRTESQISDHLQWVTSAAERITTALDSGGSLSGSGEFHSHPAEIDTLIAMRDEHYQTLALLLGSELAAKVARRQI